MKHNKLIFAILACIIVAVFLIYIGSTITEFTSVYPDVSQFTLFLSLINSMFPTCAAIVAALYFVKYIIEFKKNKSRALHIINISRVALAVLVFLAWLFHYFFQNIYMVVNTVLGALIVALFIAELIIWFVGMNKKKV